MSRAPKRGAKVVFFSETAKPTAIYFQRIPCKGPTKGPAEGQSNHDGPHHEQLHEALFWSKSGTRKRNSVENLSSSRKKCVIL